MDLINFAGAMLDTTGAIEPRAMAVLAAGIAIGMGSLGASLAIGIAASRAFDAGARQPEVFSKIQTLLLICIAFIDSLSSCARVVALLLICTVK